MSKLNNALLVYGINTAMNFYKFDQYAIWDGSDKISFQDNFDLMSSTSLQNLWN